MKKSTMKVLALIMAVIMIVGTLAVVPFSAIDNQHVHKKGTLEGTVEPTCKLYGYSVYKCEECGESFLADVTDKTEQHDWQEVGEVPATCAKPGKTAGRVCTICGEVEGCDEVTVDHVRAYKILDVHDCKEGIWYVEYCKACGEILSKPVAQGEGALVKGDDHILKADIKLAPTCKDDGVADLYCECEGCDYVIEDVVVAKLEGDNVHDWEDKTVDATFDKNAQTYKKCKVCGKETDKVDVPNTSIASKLGYNLNKMLEDMKCGESQVIEYTYNGEDGEYTLAKPACEEKLVLVGYAYDLPKGAVINSNGDVLEAKKTVLSTDFDSAQDFIEGYYDEENDVFCFGYAYYLDIADLYELYACPLETCAECEETKEIVLIEKVGDIFDEYTFEFYHVIPVEGGEDVAKFFTTFEAGYTEIVKACNEQTKKVTLTTFEKARGEEETAKIIGDGAEHKYVYVCQNEECKDEENVLVYEDVEYYICKNCEHLRLHVCLNEDTRAENGTGLCLDVEPGSVWAYGEHTRGEEKIEAKATCVAPAYYYNKCKDCGAEMPITDDEDNIIYHGEIDPENHDWSITEQTATVTLEAATCTTAGRRIIYCNRIDCQAYIVDPIPVDTENGHDLYTRDSNGLLGISRDMFIQLGLELDEHDYMEATCTHPYTEKWYCDRCKQIVYLEFGDVDPTAHGKIITVDAVELTCTEDGAYEYKYCEDCGAVIEINGEPVDELNKDDEDFLDRIIIKGDTNIFLPEGFSLADGPAVIELPGWDDVYGGDTEIEYEVVNFANGEPMFYRILSGGTGHEMTLDEGIDPDCFDAGKKDKFYCENCNYIDAEKNGAEIAALNHKNRKTQAIKSGDEEFVEERTTDVIYDIRKQEIWALRAKDVETVLDDEQGIGKIYTYEVVPATCEKDGYIVGTYCPDCMIKDDEGKAVETYSEDNIAGYLFEKVGHDDKFVGGFDQVIEETGCGAEFYSYAIYQCSYCDRYIVDDYAPSESDEHDPIVYTEDEAAAAEEDEDIEAGEAKIFTFVKVDGEYELLTDNNAGNYPECTYARYNAKVCKICGAIYDDVEIAAKDHVTADGEVIDVTCTGYNKDQIGLVCVTCGLEVPDVYVEKDENDLDVIYYYNAAGQKVASVRASEEIEPYYVLGEKKYFAIDHDWAIPQVKCEALNADILACAACGINIVNTDAATEHHEYHLRNFGGEYDFNTTVMPFDFDLFAEFPNYYGVFAFDDLTLPTFTANGFGTLTCVKCGEVLELTIPAVNAAATVELDSEDVVLVGNEVTATVKVSAKDFAFNSLILYVWIDEDYEDMIELVNAEILYPFDAIDDVRASINADGDVVIRTPGIANRNVTITGEDVPFVKLTFKTGDLTDKDEYTIIEDVEVWDIDVVRIDDEGNEIDVVGNFYVDGDLGDIVVYNPAFTDSEIRVLAQIYSTEYAAQYDFNGDGAVDLDDYFAMVDFIDSEKSIADFCALIGYDIEAMLDNEIYYDEYSSGTSWTLDPNTGAHNTTQGTEADIANAKVVIRKALKDTSYYDIAGEMTIAEFAQSVITF